MLFSLCTTALAAESEEINYIYVNSIDEIDWNLISSSTVYVVPNENVPDVDVTIPNSCIAESTLSRDSNISSDTWNIAESSHSFNGSAGLMNFALYTKYKFYGKTKYSIVCKNNSDSDQAMKLKTFWGINLNKSYTISANCTIYCFIENLDGITEDTEWYIKWPAPCDVSGTIS